jgi:hypothetical protein
LERKKFLIFCITLQSNKKLSLSNESRMPVFKESTDKYHEAEEMGYVKEPEDKLCPRT